MASQEKVNAAASARKRGRLTRDEKESLRKEWRQKSEEEMFEIIARLEVKLCHSVYSAAECVDDCTPYQVLQKTRDTLYNARLIYGSLLDNISERKYESILKIQCLSRMALARVEYQKRLQNRRNCFTGQLQADQLNESALIIQGQVRKKLAKNELSRRKNKAKDQSAPSASKNQVSSSQIAMRDLPLNDESADLVPSYRIHDVSNVVITEDEIRSQFKELDTNGNGYLSKLEFKNFYAGIDSFGVEETKESIDKILAPYNMLGDDRISYDEFAIIMLKLSQR